MPARLASNLLPQAVGCSIAPLGSAAQSKLPTRRASHLRKQPYSKQLVSCYAQEIMRLMHWTVCFYFFSSTRLFLFLKVFVLPHYSVAWSCLILAYSAS